MNKQATIQLRITSVSGQDIFQNADIKNAMLVEHGIDTDEMAIKSELMRVTILPDVALKFNVNDKIDYDAEEFFETESWIQSIVPNAAVSMLVIITLEK